MADRLIENEFAFELGAKFILANKTLVFQPKVKNALTITLTFDLEDESKLIDGPHDFSDDDPMYGAFIKDAGSHLKEGMIAKLRLGRDILDTILLQSERGDINLKTTGDKRNHGIGLIAE